MNGFKFTKIGLILSVSIYLATHFFDVELFEHFVSWLATLEEYEVDEFMIPLVVLAIFSLYDHVRLLENQEVEREKVKIYKAMLSSTHHILNNFLNQIQLFKITAESTPGFDSKVLSLYNVIINDAEIQIEALGSVTSIDEVSIRDSVAPKSN